MKFSNETARHLTDTAFAIAIQLLIDNGNQPHENQRKALYAILEAMTQMAQGSLKGRWAFGLQTGLGKTTCAMAWTTALFRLGLAGEVSVVIAAQDVASLCEAYEMLETLGVNKEHVGLLHRKDSARYPATVNAIDRPILLLCHARVRERFIEQFMYHGEMRDLLIYDESLVTTKSCTCAASTLYAIAGGLKSQCAHDETMRENLGELSTWLNEVEDAVANELVRLKDLGVTQSVMRLPQRSQETLDRFEDALKRSRVHRENETVRSLIQLCPSPVKVSNFANKGVLGYQITVPTELKNIIILDASHPIRDLVRDDTSVFDAEEHLPSLKSLGFTLASLKRYDGTTIYQMMTGGGKDSMRKSFNQKCAQQRRVCKEVVEVLRHIPQEESTLIIAFQPVYDHTGAVKFVEILEADINESGVAVMKHQNSIETPPREHPRVSITTWGLHKGTNQYKHCKNLIMVGIIHRDVLDIFGETTGHHGDLSKECTWQRLRDLQLSEVAHDAFQAIGRTQCRTVINGHAKPVNIWLIHASKNLQDKLSPVMEGAVWRKWQTKYDEIPEGKEAGVIVTAAKAVERHLSGLASSGVYQTKSGAVRKSVSECHRLTPQTFTKVLNRVMEGKDCSWVKRKQDIVHSMGLFPNV